MSDTEDSSNYHQTSKHESDTIWSRLLPLDFGLPIVLSNKDVETLTISLPSVYLNDQGEICHVPLDRLSELASKVFMDWSESHRDEKTMDNVAHYGELFGQGRALQNYILDTAKDYFSALNDKTILDAPGPYKGADFPICKSYAHRTVTIEGCLICSPMVAEGSTFDSPIEATVSSTIQKHTCVLKASDYLGELYPDSHSGCVTLRLKPEVIGCRSPLAPIWAYLSDEQRDRFAEEASQIVASSQQDFDSSTAGDKVARTSTMLKEKLKLLSEKTLSSLYETTNGPHCEAFHPLRTDKDWEEMSSPMFAVMLARVKEDLEREKKSAFSAQCMSKASLA